MSREGIRQDDPSALIDAPRLGRSLPKSLSESEINALLQAPDTNTALGIRDQAMLELMYELPSRDDVEECVVGEEVIEQGAEPVLGLKREAESA